MEGRKSKISFGEDLLDQDSRSAPGLARAGVVTRHRDKKMMMIDTLPGPFAVCRGAAVP
jgi:hypothetical protein